MHCINVSLKRKIAIFPGVLSAQKNCTVIWSIVLLTGTIVKCFFFDLWQLGGLYRVGSLLGLAICAAIIAVLLQKFVLRSAETAAERRP